MGAVAGGLMVVGGSVGRDEIHIFIFLHRLRHHLFSHLRLCGFLLLDGVVEVAVFPPDAAHEDEGHAGMSFLDGLDEGEQPLFDHFSRRIGEGIENESFALRILEGVCELGLHGAVAGNAEIAEHQAGHSGKVAGNACRSPRGADSMHEARAVQDNFMTERLFSRL